MNSAYSKEFRNSIFNYSLSTKTTEEQLKMEELFNDTYYSKKDLYKEDFRKLFKVIHIQFSKSMLFDLPKTYESLDASQTWLIYWNLHALKLLNFVIPVAWKEGIIKDIKSCQHPDGGFAGGPYQLAHLATTYGAVLALVELDSEEALACIDRSSMERWLHRIRHPDGSFSMHEGGELDVRGVYCAVTVVKLTGLDFDSIFENTAKWVASCQTYEGGFGGSPGLEAHGGYTFCAVAALIQLQSLELIDLNRLLKWTVSRQMSCEGGFQGRTNKLVDSCYSFWVGAILSLLHRHLPGPPLSQPLCDVGALCDYILVCCQRLREPVHNPSGGGLIDKPGKNADPYHTCYALSGLAVAQQYLATVCRDPDTCQTVLAFNDDLYNITSSALKHHIPPTDSQ